MTIKALRIVLLVNEVTEIILAHEKIKKREKKNAIEKDKTVWPVLYVQP